MASFHPALRAQAPDFNFRQLGSEEGLNNPNIFNIEQHENGLMYFTTQNGIYFYDGYSFQKLTTDSLKSNALEAAKIKDRDELFLSVRAEGIATFNLHTGKYFIDPLLRVRENNADQLIVTDQFAFLLTTQIRLTIIERATGRIIDDELRKKNELNLPHCLYRTKEGRVIVGRSDGIYDVTSGAQKRLSVLENISVHALTEDKEGNVLAGGAGVIYLLSDMKVVSETRLGFKVPGSTFLPGGQRTVSRIIADNFGRIWFTAFPDDNLYLYQHNRVYNVFDVLEIQPSLINCIYKDRRDDIWVGTMSDGVYQIQNTYFQSLNFSYDNKILNVNEVVLRGNLLVAATSNGLYGLNLKTHTTKTLSHPDRVFLEPVYSVTSARGALFYTKRNELNMSPSIFLDANYTYRFRPLSGRKFLPLDGDQSLLASWDGYIFLCNGEGSKVTDTLVSFSDYRIAVNAMLVHEEILYIGTNNGLFSYDLKTDDYQNIVRDELNFSINDLRLINGKLYAAHDGGLTDVFGRKLIREVGNLPLNTVRKIRSYAGQIWLATLDGVYLCDSLLMPQQVLNKATGLLSNSVNDISFDEGRVAIATARGIGVAYFKDIVRYRTRLRPVTVSCLRADGVELRSEENIFRIGAEAEDLNLIILSPLFNKSNKQYFRYRENGGKWNYTENLTQLPFPNLAGGTHKIELSASADNILWSQPTSVTIEKEQKLTEKQILYWIITLAALVVIILFSYFWIRRVKARARRRLAEEQQVNLLKHQAMNALLSPHFIFNSLTSIQNYINTNNSLRASEYLAKFSRLIRMIIEKAAQSHISLHDELSRLTYYLELEKERFKNKFDYEINIDEEINTHKVMIPNMIIQPYVENSILHGILPTHAPGKLWINFRKTNARKLTITIEDNGIGLIKAAEHAKTGHKSLGTSTIRTILEVNSKLSGKVQKVSMEDKSTTDPATTGTVITIELEL